MREKVYNPLLGEYVLAQKAAIAFDAEWKEEAHPRDADGKFGSGGEEGGASLVSETKLPEKQIAAFESTMATLQERTTKRSIEYGAVVLSDGRALIAEGASNNLIVSKAQMEALREAGRNGKSKVLFTHTHPGAEDRSGRKFVQPMSYEDIELTMNMPGIAEHVVVTHTGAKEVLSIPETGRRVSREEFRSFYDKTYKATHAKMSKTMRGVSPGLFTSRLYTQVNKIIAKHYGWEYKGARDDN